MGNGIQTPVARGRRVRSALLVFCAVVLFLAGLLLLLAPAPAQGEGSRVPLVPSPCGGDGWIMGAQSYQASFLAGG